MAGPNFTMARALLALILVAVAAGLFGYSLRPRPQPQTPEAANAPAPPLPIPQAPLAALDRAAFLSAAASAASNFATGTGSPLGADVVGRQFEIRAPFGCFGASAAGQEDQAYWRDDDQRRSITVGVRTQVWTAAPWRGVLDPQHAAEAIEGFWIPRPWILDESCPVGVGPPPPSAAAGPSVGLAQIYARGGSRTERRDSKPYEVTRPAPTEGGTAGPFVLVLSGRIAGYADGAAFHCLPALPNQRPTCVAAVEFSRVRIQSAGKGEVLGEWDS